MPTATEKLPVKVKAHKEVEAPRVKPFPQNMWYCGKSWKAKFACPTCGRNCVLNLNFMGRRRLFCVGTKFIKKLPERKE